MPPGVIRCERLDWLELLWLPGLADFKGRTLGPKPTCKGLCSTPIFIYHTRTTWCFSWRFKKNFDQLSLHLGSGDISHPFCVPVFWTWMKPMKPLAASSWTWCAPQVFGNAPRFPSLLPSPEKRKSRESKAPKENDHWSHKGMILISYYIYRLLYTYNHTYDFYMNIHVTHLQSTTEILNYWTSLLWFLAELRWVEARPVGWTAKCSRGIPCCMNPDTEIRAQKGACHCSCQRTKPWRRCGWWMSPWKMSDEPMRIIMKVGIKHA
jgi:hypothetical protein